MACPFADCQNQEAQVEVRYGAREVDCPRCGRFKMSDALFEADQTTVASDQERLDQLHHFIHARNAEGKVPLLTAENWEWLGSERAEDKGN